VVLLLSIRTGFLDELESRNGLSVPGLCVLEGVLIGPIMMLTDCQATPARVVIRSAGGFFGIVLTVAFARGSTRSQVQRNRSLA
jgi:hypothetical protein